MVKATDIFRKIVRNWMGNYASQYEQNIRSFGCLTKAGQIYMLTAHLPRVNTIRHNQMKELPMMPC